MMQALPHILAENRQYFGHQWPLPEYRQIELYTQRRKLPFAAGDPVAPGMADRLLGLHVAVMLLEAYLTGGNDDLMEGVASWDRYLALPKKSPVEKLIAEVYRILRIFRIAAVHRDGRIEFSEGLLRMSCTFKRCALSLNVTPAGARLLECFVHVFLDLLQQPYSEAYGERLLLQYFLDIVAEVRKFADEDRILYQFRQQGCFNRHFRFDCDNPKFEAQADGYRFEIGGRYDDPARYPIDFFVVIKDVLHIIPVEAMQDGCIREADLVRWQVKAAFRQQLPAGFQSRFGREVMTVGLPMT